MIAFMKKFGSIISNINANYDYYDKTNLIINAFVNSGGYQYIGRADLKDFIRGNFGAIYNIYLKTLIDVFVTNAEFCGGCNIFIGEAERKIMSYIADEVFSEEDNYYSLGQYMMSKMISDVLVELQMTINDKLEAIKGITVIADIVSILGMVAGGISKTGVTLSIPSVVQAGGTAVLGGSTVAISAEVVAAAAVAASEVIIVVSLAVGEVALVFCSANENAAVQVKNSGSAVKKVSERGSNPISDAIKEIPENKKNHILNGTKSARKDTTAGHSWQELFNGEKPNFEDVEPLLKKAYEHGKCKSMEVNIGNGQKMVKDTYTIEIDGKEVWLNTINVNGKLIIEDGGVNIK